MNPLSSMFTCLVRASLPRLVFFFILLLPAAGNAQAPNIQLNLNWNYVDSSAEGSSKLFQTYRGVVNHDAYLTRLLQADASASYYRNIQSGGLTSDTLSPSGGLSLVNEFFRSDLSVYHNRTGNSDDFSSRSTQWQLHTASTWSKRFWPGVSFFIDQQKSETDKSGSETTTSKMGSSLSWDLEYLDIGYSFNIDRSEASGAGSENTNTNHAAQLTGSWNFLKNRMSSRLALRFSQVIHKFSAATGPTGSVLAPSAFPVSVWGGDDVDGTALISDLDAAFPLTIGVAPAGSRAFVVQGDFRQTNLLYLYTVVDQTLNKDALQWDVYVSPDGNQPGSWTLHASDVKASYDAGRFEVPVNNVVAGYDVKLLVRLRPNSLILTPPGAVRISRIELYRMIQGTGGVAEEETTAEQYGGNLNLGFRLRKDINCTYNASYEQNVNEQDEQTRLRQAASLAWRLSSRVNASVNMSDSRETSNSGEESNKINYSAGLMSSLLPTLNVNLSLTRTESYEQSELQSTSHNANLTSIARLFRDLDGQLVVSYSKSESVVPPTSESRSISTKMRLTARVTPRLTTNLDQSYTTSLGDDGADTLASSLWATWRLSDLLFSQSTFTYSHAANTDTMSFGQIVNWTVTRKIKTDINYLLSVDDVSTAQTVTMNLYYNFSKFISLRTNGAFSTDEQGSAWNMGVSLSMRYSGF
jgi:hypothetical protein